MGQIIAFLETDLMGIAVWMYLGALGAILLGFIGKKITALVFGHFLRMTGKTRLPWDDMLVHALSKPVEWGVAIAGLAVATLILPVPREPVNVEKFLYALLSGLAVALVVWVGIRLVDGVMGWWEVRASKTDSKLDDQLVPIVRRSLKVFLFLIGIVLVMQNMGYSVAGLLAGLGIGGLAVAMASKDTVANLFGSVVIFLDKPFQIGDWIEMGAVEGTVEEVGLRTTRVRTFANSLITLPNAAFTNEAVNNWSKMKKRRIKMNVGVTYSTPPKKIDELVARLRSIIEDDPNIKNDFYLVNFDNFGPSSLDIFIYCFTETTVWAEFLQVKQDLMLKIMEAVSGMGLSFAFPTQSIHVESFAGEPAALSGQRPR
ncbi:MAG TPA: mechanosensitive ion channel family protein [Polyangia bacterium]|nr:mechanosensitive ion channel family protein [Polyangia bacterium]